MSIENSGLPSVDVHYITAVEAVRGLAESVVRERNNEEFLRLTAALGQIAGGLREFSSSEHSSIHTPHLEVVGTYSAADAAVNLTIEAQPAEVDEVLGDPVVPKQQQAVDNKHANETGITVEQQQIAELYPGLTLSPNEAKLMIAIMETNGKQFKAGDVKDVLHQLTPASKSYTIATLVRKITASPYSDSLGMKGERAARVYWWRGHQISPETISEVVAEPVVDVRATVFEAKPEDMQEDVAVNLHETESNEEDPLAFLASHGIDHAEDERSFSVRGVPLRLTKTGAKVLIKIAEYNGATTYKMLVNDEELLGVRGSTAARELTTALAEIGAQLRYHNVPWKDKKLPDASGKSYRVIELGNRTPSPRDIFTDSSSTFLAMGR